MPKKSSVKSLSSDASTTVVSAPVVEQVVPPVVEKKQRKVKSVATVSPVEVVTTETPVSTPSVDIVVDSIDGVITDTETSLMELSNDFIGKLQQLSSLLSALKGDYRILEKKWTREVKTAQKSACKRRRKASNRAPSGFVKPTKISDELANFLGKDSGIEMARTDVTREINTYIRANNLQDKENGRKINPDGKLAKLLKLDTTDVLTYFNLQKYMSPHFAKAIKEDPTVAAVTSIASVVVA